METQNNGRILVAELVGTAVLMLGGPGVAIFSFQYVGVAGVAAGFGLSLLIMAYVIGPISGCHINPAVTLGMLLSRKINGTHAVFAVIGQLIGAVGGAAIIYGIASGRDDWQRGSFASNLWSGKHFGVGAAIVTEVILTALLVMVVLFTTTRKFAPGFEHGEPGARGSARWTVEGCTLEFAETSTGALEQLWVFIVFPLVGAVVGVVLFLILDDTRLEDTMLAEVPGLSEVRDTLENVTDEAVEAIEDGLD